MHWDLANKKLRTQPARIFLRPVLHFVQRWPLQEPGKATTRYAPRIVLLLSELCLVHLLCLRRDIRWSRRPAQWRAFVRSV